MKAKQLIKLPFGSYLVTDGKSEYEIRKQQNDYGTRDITYTLRGSNWHDLISIYIEQTPVYEGGIHPQITMPVLIARTCKLGFLMSSNEWCDQFQKLQFVPRGRFQWFIERTQTKEITKTPVSEFTYADSMMQENDRQNEKVNQYHESQTIHQ